MRIIRLPDRPAARRGRPVQAITQARSASIVIIVATVTAVMFRTATIIVTILAVSPIIPVDATGYGAFAIAVFAAGIDHPFAHDPLLDELLELVLDD